MKWWKMQGTKKITSYYIAWIFKISLLLPDTMRNIPYIMQCKKFIQCILLSRLKIEHIVIREYRIILPITQSKLIQKIYNFSQIKYHSFYKFPLSFYKFPLWSTQTFHFPSPPPPIPSAQRRDRDNLKWPR